MDTKTKNDVNIIKETVINHTNVDLKNHDINKSRRSEYFNARMHYFNLCREFTKMSLNKIGQTIRPSKDHATVLHAIRTFETIKQYPKIGMNQSIINEHTNIKSKVRYLIEMSDQKEMDVFEAVKQLYDLEKDHFDCLARNNELLNQINQLNEQIAKQNKYLVENYGYDATRSNFNTK